MATKKTDAVGRAAVQAVRVALFVEGKNLLTPRGRDDLAALWKGLCTRMDVPSSDVVVFGFTKGNLVQMDETATITSADRRPLDAMIAVAHDERPFERLVVAFDALPANQVVMKNTKGACLASERDFLLDRLAKSVVLPARFKSAAAALLAYYAGNRGRPRRPRTRPPFGDVEVIYMDPCFEALLLTDAAAIRDVFGLKSVPKAWPGMPYRSQKPDVAIAQLIDGHRREGPRHLRIPWRDAKHAWAHEIVKSASKNSRLFQHDIARRLGEFVA